jgi:hypothetical protein
VPVLVGLDFDNTIVCYDGLFRRLAEERGLLGADVPPTKGGLRDYLRRIDREDDWTELQGVAYGPRLVEADPFPGVKEFLARCLRAGLRCVIISHKTKRPYLGPAHDLHGAAHGWLKAHGFYDTFRTGLAPDTVYLELTKQAKLDRIGALGCDYFIDDLPEFLAEPSFPPQPRKVLFDPADACPDNADYRRVRSWAEVTTFVLGGEGAAA